MGDPLAVHAALAHGLGDFGKSSGGLGGDGGGGLFRAELLGVREDPAQELPLFRIDQFLDADLARFVRIAGKGGVDDNPLPVGDDQKGRVFELQGIVGELFEGGGKVAAGLFVLPAEAAPLPDIGPAVAAVRFLGPALEAVVVRVARLVHAEQVAEIVEVGLRPAPFGELVVLPESNEFFSGH